MKNIVDLVCQAFIHKDPAKTRLLAFLDLPLRKGLSGPCNTDITLGFDQNKQLINWVHFSWFTPFLRSCSQQEISVFLGIFPPASAEALAQTLLFSSPVSKSLPIVEEFLQNRAAAALTQEVGPLFPIESIAKENDFYPLLLLSCDQLLSVTQFLGLYDLAPAFSQIIDTSKLKKIQGCLTKEQVSFLSGLLQKKQALVFKQLRLEHWNGDPKDLLDVLQKRGMNRLAKALHSADSTLVQMIKLRMSREQAALLSSLSKETESQRVVPLLKEQIFEVLSFLQLSAPRQSS